MNNYFQGYKTKAKAVFSQISQGDDQMFITHMLHVWNIYLHLAQIYGKCLGKYSTHSSHMGNKGFGGMLDGGGYPHLGHRIKIDETGTAISICHDTQRCLVGFPACRMRRNDQKNMIKMVSLGLSPLPVIVEMKVYRDSLLKM